MRTSFSSSPNFETKLPQNTLPPLTQPIFANSATTFTKEEMAVISFQAQDKLPDSFGSLPPTEFATDFSDIYSHTSPQQPLSRPPEPDILTSALFTPMISSDESESEELDTTPVKQEIQSMLPDADISDIVENTWDYCHRKSGVPQLKVADINGRIEDRHVTLTPSYGRRRLLHIIQQDSAKRPQPRVRPQTSLNGSVCARSLKLFCMREKSPVPKLLDDVRL